jgi:hypothetical protein|tara:strand:- start:106 stop:369 length:264 start_codon:yes stop_codon:yes gene_type:complete
MATKKRDYKKEYERDQSSTRRRKYRSELNKRARTMGHYGKTPAGKDLVHKNGSIAGLGDRKQNRSDGARKATFARMKRKRRIKRRQG